jgi:two-component system, LytTR family, response regulator
MNCLIIEDEPLASLRLRDFLARLPFASLCASVDNAMAGLDVLRKQKVDLIFLDIEMDGFSGIQFLESLPTRPEVILTTAFDQYALKAFDLKVADYLLKPFTFERFVQAVTRVYERLDKLKNETSNPFIFVKTEYRLQKVSFDEILFIEGMRDYRRIHLTGEKIMTLETFGDLEKQLPEKQFCRVHKSYLVALNRIESIERERIVIGKTLVPVSDTYKEHFFKLIGRPVKG